MSHRAQIETRSALLFTEFGEQMAARHFTPEQLATVPRYVRGKHVGKMKGVIEWKKVTRGGWVSEGNYHGTPIGYVERRVGRIISASIKPDAYGNGTHLSQLDCGLETTA